MSHDSYPEPVGDILGSSVPRRDARAKVTGRAVYTDDIVLPGMLHAALLGSPHAHARILSYDVSGALALPGVKVVLTANDLPDVGIGPVFQDQPVLARGKVRYVGEPVVAVAAVDIDTARRALEEIHIEYEVLTPVFDPEAALQPGAPIVHDSRAGEPLPNAISQIRIIEGEPDEKWDECDVIVEGVYEAPAQQHVYLEPNSTVAVLDPDTDRITIYTATQTAFRVQVIVADALAMPMTKIRVIVPRVGGAFGGKTETTFQPITAALAKAAGGAPVKLTMSREDDMRMNKTRHGCRIYMRTGAKYDGRILVREARMYLDTGAYADDGPFVAGLTAYFGRGPYRIPHTKLEVYGVYTNRLRAGAFRGFGIPQSTFASEIQIDELAERLGKDPIDLRIMHALETGERWLGGERVQSGTLAACLRAVKEASSWTERRTPTTPSPGKRRGIGVASVGHVCALLGSSATVRLNEDGTLAVITGCTDTGPGSDTALSQCAAAVLGLPLDHISFSAPDTDSTPYDWCSAGTRATFTVGRVITKACERVKEMMFQAASEILDRPVQALELRPGGIVGVRNSATELPFRGIAGYSLYVKGGPIVATERYLWPASLFDRRTTVEGLSSMGNGMFIFGAQVMEVEVDEVTGQVEVIEAWSAHDVGRVINAAAAEGQVEGGVVQGLGYALYEEPLWTADGIPVTTSMSDYKVPGAPDVPNAIHPILLEIPAGDGPFGAKGVAEAGLNAVAPAVCNAIRHATGASVTKIPATGERVLQAIAEIEP